MLNLLFPKLCNACNDKLLRSEKVICSRCRHALPLSCHHRNDNEQMKQIFYGRFPIEQATSLLKFQKKNLTQQLMHNLKYRGREEVSYFFGKWLGAELKDIASYKQVDLVIPVPLHKKKRRKRGYNQVSGFGKEIAMTLEIPFREDILVKVSRSQSQVSKQRRKRFGSEELFTLLDPTEITNKHVLLVDDIVTTGATIENCAEQLLQAPGVRISVATIAIA